MPVESETLELKQELGDLQGILKTSCAFANTHGGKILVGVKNDGTFIGLPEQELDSIQQRIVQALHQLQPSPMYHLDIVNDSGVHTVQVEIEPMMYGTLCSFQGSIYFRHGSVTERADGHVLQDLLSKRKIFEFDRIQSRVVVKELDLRAIEYYLKNRNPEMMFSETDLDKYLVGMGVLPQFRSTVVNNAGVIFFHPRPSDVLSQVEIKLARFKSTTPTQVIDAVFISGPMLSLLNEAEAFIQRNTKVSFEFKGMDRIEVPEYPIRAIREALVNAVAHRDYFDNNAIQVNIFSNRIEFLNPGQLPDGMTLEELGAYSVQRNPLIYKLLRDVHKVEGLAIGIPKMREDLMNGGYPPPSFTIMGGRFFRLTIFNKEFSGMEWLNEMQRSIIRIARRDGHITTDAIVQELHAPRSTVMDQINGLVEKGVLKKVGKTKGTKYHLGSE